MKVFARRCPDKGLGDGDGILHWLGGRIRRDQRTLAADRLAHLFVAHDDTGERRTRTFNLRDPGSLLEEARAGGFWCHVAGTAHHMVTTFAAKIAHVGVGIAIDNYDTNLPVKKGLSSSAAVCVLVARAFSRVFDLGLTVRDEMDAAYRGERTTPSRCGRMDQVSYIF